MRLEEVKNQKPSYSKQRSDEYKVEELLRQYSSSEKVKYGIKVPQ